MFNISVMQAHKVYLDLPTFSMRNKREQFSCIRDRALNKLQGCNENFFSMGGKEVLIKLVIQAILTYAMSCFAFPSSIIWDIKRACASFGGA